MSTMYSALNQDYMYQEMHDRAARMNAHHPKENTVPNRRWWRKAARVAR
jgi:hypothetical protein